MKNRNNAVVTIEEIREGFKVLPNENAGAALRKVIYT